MSQMAFFAFRLSHFLGRHEFWHVLFVRQVLSHCKIRNQTLFNHRSFGLLQDDGNENTIRHILA